MDEDALLRAILDVPEWVCLCALRAAAAERHELRVSHQMRTDVRVVRASLMSLQALGLVLARGEGSWQAAPRAVFRPQLARALSTLRDELGGRNAEPRFRCDACQHEMSQAELVSELSAGNLEPVCTACGGNLTKRPLDRAPLDAAVRALAG